MSAREDSALATGAAAPKRRRWLRRLLALAIVFTLLSLLATWLLPPMSGTPTSTGLFVQSAQ